MNTTSSPSSSVAAVEAGAAREESTGTCTDPANSPGGNAMRA